jgi:hypothetical protein
MIAYATHFTAVALFVVQAGFFVFALRGRAGFVRRWLAAQIVASVPILFWLYIATRQPLNAASEWIPRPDLYDIPLTLWNMTLGYDGVFKWELVPGLMIATLGLVFGIGAAIRERRGGEAQRADFYWALLIAAAFVPVYLMSRYLVSIYVDRYFVVTLPAILLLMIRGWRHYPRRVWRAAMVIVIATGIYSVVFALHAGSFRRDDWRPAASYVAEGYQPGDVILMGPRNSYAAFMRYYYIDVDDNGSMGISESDQPVFATAPESQVVLFADTPDTTAVEQSARRLWVVYRNPNEDVHRMGLMPDFDPFDPTLSDLGKWLYARQDQVIDQRAYNGVRILLLDPSRPVAAREQ